MVFSFSCACMFFAFFAVNINTFAENFDSSAEKFNLFAENVNPFADGDHVSCFENVWANLML